ncbi:hypothetical protein C8R47DRAFT_816098 [Mycena vitilis]|nr:hypothetical protein C8R47DRAFT_816098 [Mycena vitilis]
MAPVCPSWLVFASHVLGAVRTSLSPCARSHYDPLLTFLPVPPTLRRYRLYERVVIPRSAEVSATAPLHPAHLRLEAATTARAGDPDSIYYDETLTLPKRTRFPRRHGSSPSCSAPCRAFLLATPLFRRRRAQRRWSCVREQYRGDVCGSVGALIRKCRPRPRPLSGTSTTLSPGPRIPTCTVPPQLVVWTQTPFPLILHPRFYFGERIDRHTEAARAGGQAMSAPVRAMEAPLPLCESSHRGAVCASGERPIDYPQAFSSSAVLATLHDAAA